MTQTQTTCLNHIALSAAKKGTHPDEFGALASVFEKSATELKHKNTKMQTNNTNIYIQR